MVGRTQPPESSTGIAVRCSRRRINQDTIIHGIRIPQRRSAHRDRQGRRPQAARGRPRSRRHLRPRPRAAVALAPDAASSRSSCRTSPPAAPSSSSRSAARRPSTLIREIQRHPFKKQILHVDFQELVAGEKVTVEIPLVFVGVPEGVRLSGALLEQIMHSIEVRVDPANIPNHIDVDVTQPGDGSLAARQRPQAPRGRRGADGRGRDGVRRRSRRAPSSRRRRPRAPRRVAEPELIRKTKEEEDGEVIRALPRRTRATAPPIRDGAVVASRRRRRRR